MSGRVRYSLWRMSLQLADFLLVPKGGLEPPHPCGHMTLNHARLPIPPLRLGQGLHLTDRGYEVKGPAASQA